MPLRNAVTCALTTALILSSTVLVKADLPKVVRESTTAGGSKAEIEKYVAGLVEKIVKKDTKAGQYRDELASQCYTNPTGTVAPSPTFKLDYVSATIPALKPLMTDADPTMRIHAAIVIARLTKDAGAAASSQLQDPTSQLLNDPSIAVQLYGVKAAGSLFQPLFSVNINLQNEKLSSTIVSIVTKNPKSGPMLQEAYKGFDLTGLTPPVSPAGLCRATDRTNEILSARVQQYVTGTPVEPQTDRVATGFLSKGEARNAAKADATQAGKDRILKVMQNLLDLTSVSADRANTLSGSEKTRMLKVTEAAAGAIYALVDANPSVATPLKPLMGASGKPPATPATDVTAVLNALKTLPDYKNLKNPPAIAATTQPSADAASGK